MSALPHAILFDMDNTFYAYDIAHKAAQKAVQTKVVNNLSIDEKTFDSAYITTHQQIKTRLKSTASSHSRLLYFQRTFEIIGLGSQILLSLDCEQTYWRIFLSNATLFVGLKDFLDDIRLLGIPTAIITDLTAQIQFRKVIYFELENYFDYIVTSEESGYDKPHHLIFELALKKIRPQGSNIWMIGDNPQKDIDGAHKNINAITLQKIHAGVDININANITFNHFAELRKLLVRIENKSIKYAEATIT